MELAYYVCVTGDRVLLPEGVGHAISEVAPAALWESLISCPITQEYFQDPVLLTATGNTYERAAIIQWLSEHDNDPLTGVRLVDTNVVPNAALRALLYRLEARDDTLLYHDLECEQLLAQFQAIYQCKRADQLYEMPNPWAVNSDQFKILINDGVPYVDVSVHYVTAKQLHSTLGEAAVKAITISIGRSIRLAHSECSGVPGISVVERPSYALGGIAGLLRCPVSGKPLLRAVVTDAGISYDADIVAAERYLDKNQGYTWGELRAHELICDGNAVNNNVIRQICAEVFTEATAEATAEATDDIAELDGEPTVMTLCADCLWSDHDMCQQCSALWIHETYLNRKLDDSVYTYRNRLKLYRDVRNQDISTRYMRPRDNALESMWQKVEHARSIVDQMPHELMILNKYAREFLVKQGSKFYHGDNELVHRRRQLRLPYTEGSTYGTDLSFLDLSNMVFRDTNFKDFVFCGANLYGVRFNGCNFNYCNFAGATLTACVFNKCKFDECELSYKTIGAATYVRKKEF